MKPAPFSYHAPERLEEAAALLASYGDAAKPLAGGQSLVPMLSLRLGSFEHLVDLNRITSLATIQTNSDHIRVGATVRQATAEHSSEIAKAAPLVSKALPLIGHFQIRNRGTVGGSIAHADPASELPAVALALGATLEAAGANGTRRIAASDFFISTWETSLAENEILSAIEFPIWTGRCGFAVDEIARRHGDFALVGAAVGIQLDAGNKISKAAIALFGVGATPIRAHDAEAALLSGVDANEAGRLAANSINPSADIHATAAYRKQVAAVVVRRAITAALADANAPTNVSRSASKGTPS